MTVVARIEGPIGPGELIEKLERILQDNEVSLIAARAEREERDFTQTLRREQDAAFLKSSKADQEKERKRREEQDKIDQEKQRLVDEENKRKEMIQERERMKEELKIEIPEEPAVDDPDVVRIVLRLPHGSRTERRFLKNQSLKFLYYFAFCHEDCPDDFHVVTNFPEGLSPVNPQRTALIPLPLKRRG
eukprot:XP_011446172.1 PREDICTED: FAS-associated factor 2-B-like [Crassostrea gigas]